MFLILILSQAFMTLYTVELSRVVLATVLLDPGLDLPFCFKVLECYFISFEIKLYEPFIRFITVLWLYLFL